MTTISAAIREPSGKGGARKVRALGQVPATLYGQGKDPVSLAVDPDLMVRYYRQEGHRNAPLTLDIDGANVAVLVREVQRHPVSRNILHVDFFRLAPDVPVQVMVKVEPHGRLAGAIMGGRLRVIRRELRAECLPKDIPASFPVDVSPLEVGDMVSASEIPMPDGVSLVFDNDYKVLTCYGKRGPKGGEVEEAAEADGSSGEAATSEES